jgi:hypothetical protein
MEEQPVTRDGKGGTPPRERPAPWTYWAVVGLGRTRSNPYSVFRHNSETIEQWQGRWVYQPSLLRYVMGDDMGADVITLSEANRLTGGNARERPPDPEPGEAEPQARTDPFRYELKRDCSGGYSHDYCVITEQYATLEEAVRAAAERRRERYAVHGIWETVEKRYVDSHRVRG